MDNVKVLVRGGNVSFWYDKWLASSLLSVRVEDVLNFKLCIKNCWLNNTWNMDLLIELMGMKITEETVQSVLAGKKG